MLLLVTTGVGYAVLKGRASPAQIVTGAAPALIELAPSETYLVKPADIRRTVPLPGSLSALNQAVLRRRLSLGALPSNDRSSHRTWNELSEARTTLVISTMPGSPSRVVPSRRMYLR